MRLTSLLTACGVMKNDCAAAEILFCSQIFKKHSISRIFTLTPPNKMSWHLTIKEATFPKAASLLSS